VGHDFHRAGFYRTAAAYVRRLNELWGTISIVPVFIERRPRMCVG
jgi:hypothetical protein